MFCWSAIVLLGCATDEDVGEVPPGCGNDVLEEGEQCDPPSDAGCSPACRIQPTHLNRCPELRFLFVAPRQTTVGQELILEAEVVDPDGDEVHIQWEAPGGLFEHAGQAETTYTCQEAGPRRLTVRFSDQRGCEAEDSAEVRCLP